MQQNLQTSTNKIFNGLEILASGSADSIILDLNELKSRGFFSLHVTTTGTGTATFTYLLSNRKDGVDALTPSGASDIATNFAAGTDMFSFAPMVAKYMIIRCVETSTTNPINVTVDWATQ